MSDVPRDDFIDLDDGLATPGSGAPDLTRSIMARLGYMRVSERVARRRRRRGWMIRFGAIAAAAAFMAIGLELYEAGPNARRPSGPTFNSALGNDVARTQQHLDRTIKTIRGFQTLLGPDGSAVDTRDTHSSPYRRGVGPAGIPGLIQPRPLDAQRQTPRDGNRGRGAPDPIDEFIDEPIDEDVEYSGIGPVRWL